MKKRIAAATSVLLIISGVSWWFFIKENASPANSGTPIPSASAAPADALTKERLDKIAATINKDEPKSEKLKSQASVIAPSLRPEFLKLNTPIGNITFGDDMTVKGHEAQVSSTGAGGIAYLVHLVYVEDPATGIHQWLVLYTEPKQ